MTKSKKQIIGLVVVSIILFILSINLLVTQVKDAYTKYQQSVDDSKKKCFDEFKSFEYEVISGELYCKTVEGFVKADPNFNK